MPPTLVTTTALRAGLAKVTFNQAASPVAAEFLRNQLPATLSNGASTGAVYDPQGNLTQIYPFPGDAGEAVNLGYDALGKVNSVSYVSSGNQVTENYLHDDEGLRMKVVDSLGNTRYNIYDDARRLVAQFAKIGTGPLAWKKDIVYAGTRELGEVSPGGVDVVTLCDHLGSPRFQWDGSTPPTQQKFLTFGEMLDDPTSAGKFAKGFTNHEQTDASGLIYMQARFYLPGWGRFASPDPARDQHTDLTQSWNIYSYVRNSPMLAIDPTGMQDATVEKGPPVPTNSMTHLTNNETQLKYNADHGFSNPPPSQPAQGGKKEGTKQEGADKKNPGKASGKGKKPVPDNVKRFLENKELMKVINGAAKSLGVDVNFVLAHSAYESGWGGEHAQDLNNSFGLTHGGGRNIKFDSAQDGANMYITIVDSYIHGVKSMGDYITGIRGAGYNATNPNYDATLQRTYSLVVRSENALGVKP